MATQAARTAALEKEIVQLAELVTNLRGDLEKLKAEKNRYQQRGQTGRTVNAERLAGCEKHPTSQKNTYGICCNCFLEASKLHGGSTKALIALGLRPAPEG